MRLGPQSTDEYVWWTQIVVPHLWKLLKLNKYFLRLSQWHKLPWKLWGRSLELGSNTRLRNGYKIGSIAGVKEIMSAASRESMWKLESMKNLGVTKVVTIGQISLNPWWFWDRAWTVRKIQISNFGVTGRVMRSGMELGLI